MVGCSGGADSLALLAFARGLDVVAVHVDHGIRAATGHEAALVAEAAASFGAAFREEAVVVEAGSNLKAHAGDRESPRSSVLTSTPVRPLCLSAVRDDQAETVLLNLLHGGDCRTRRDARGGATCAARC